jgi:hypothetical protein
MLNKEHADKIKKKLKAKINKGKKNRPHDLAVIYHEDKMIASFGIRRGSNKHLPHDHIPQSLHLKPHDCLDLAQCKITREEWLKRMQDQGFA